MSTEDDFIDPGDLQAKANTNKIKWFIGAIAKQMLILTMVVYAVALNNAAADVLLTVYIYLMAGFCLTFIYTTFRPLASLVHKVSVADDLLTPTRKFIFGLGTVVSMVEISILATHGWYFVAGLWFFTEIFQWTACYREQVALASPLRGENMLQKHCDANPEFKEAFESDMYELSTEIEKIDQTIRALEVDEDYSDAYNALVADRGLVIARMEKRVEKAATDTIDAQGPKDGD